MRDTAIKSVMCRFSVCEHWTGKKNVYRCVTYTDELQNSETLKLFKMKTTLSLLLISLLLVLVSIVTTNIYMLGIAELIGIPSIIILLIKQQKYGN